jgi:hypothetical protein
MQIKKIGVVKLENNNFKIIIDVSKFCGEYKCYLPEDFQLEDYYKQPVDILVKQEKGIGEWEATEIFRRIWPDILEFLTNLQENSVGLVYFASQTWIQNYLQSFIRYISLERGDKIRFFIREMMKNVKDKEPFSGCVCLEYDYENFKKLVGPSGFDYFPGELFVMGIIVNELKIEPFLSMYVRDKNILKDILTSEYVSCWWMCGSDQDGMTIWHKKHSGAQIAEKIKESLNTKIGYKVEVVK